MFSSQTRYPLKAHLRDLIFLKNFITNPLIEVGEYTYYHDINGPELFERNNVVMPFSVKLKIGKFCQIAQGSKFIMSDANHPMSGFSTFPFFVFGDPIPNYDPKLPPKGDTVIGNDVWLGHHSTVMPRVKIGDGAIVGSFSLVTKDVAPYTIVGGNPAKLIRPRFDESTIQALLEIQWWNWDIEKIIRNVEAIAGADLDRLKQAT